MNTENETGVKVPKGQINYNTVAGSLGLAAFAGLGLRNRRESADERIFDYANCNFVKYIKKINAAEICPVVELAARTAGPAVPDPNAPTTSTVNA